MTAASVKFHNSEHMRINESEYVMPIPSNMAAVINNQAADGDTAISPFSASHTPARWQHTQINNMKLFSSDSHTENVVAQLSVCDYSVECFGAVRVG